MKQVARSLKIDLASFGEMKSFAQFGSDLDASTVSILKHGEVLLQVLRQPQYKPYSLDHEIFELFMAKNKYLDNVALPEVKTHLEGAYKYVKSTKPVVLKNINEKKEISNDDEKLLKQLIEEYFKMNETK